MQKNILKKRLIIGVVVLTILAISVSLFLSWNRESSPEKQTEALKVEQYNVDFKDNAFASNVELQLLKEIGICDSTKVNDEMGACSPKYFKFFPLSTSKPLKDGFILLINGLAFADPDAKFPVRRTLIFEREGGVLVAVNKFKGNIIERRQIKGSNYDDIVIRFRLDQYNEKYHVVYSWKQNRYQFNRCEELVYFDYDMKKFVGGRVLKAKQDSVSKVVEKILIEEQLVF